LEALTEEEGLATGVGVEVDSQPVRRRMGRMGRRRSSRLKKGMRWTRIKTEGSF